MRVHATLRLVLNSEFEMSFDPITIMVGPTDRLKFMIDNRRKISLHYATVRPVVTVVMVI